VGGSRDRDNMGTQIPHPGEAKLSGSDPLPLCDLGEFLDDLDVLLYVLFGKTFVAEADVILAEVCAGFDLSGEEAPAEGGVGDDCDSEILGCCDD